MVKKIELLAPAKSYEYGIAAVDAGADAVYIGAPKFGARYGATNTLDDIKRLTDYAHLFDVKVFVTLNTVLFDDELEQAKSIAQSLVLIGVDALIIQDMSYLMFGLEIPLHASTQAAALTPEKVLFYQEAGFERVILERAMSIDDIAEIRKRTTVDLEAFVHGAICVSMSGQCYMGEVVAGRSGNRGVCSQPCRALYTLKNELNETLIQEKHLLSLLDLNLSDYVPQLIDTGVTSFKIEGRLKDLSYLKNSVAHYRQVIDTALSNRTGYERSSTGKTTIPFTPNPIKTFSRRYTSYFISGKTTSKIASFNSAKALGEEIGTIQTVERGYFTVQTADDFCGGDGICFIDKSGNFGGTNVNKAERIKETVRIYPNKMDGITKGATLYRNNDKRFIDEVTIAKTVRKIDARIEVRFSEDAIHLTATDQTGATATMELQESQEPAHNPERAMESLRGQLSKSGDTIFAIQDVSIVGEVGFMPVARINTLRRELLEKLKNNKRYNRNEAPKQQFPTPYCKELDYTSNVTNRLAREFYIRCGFNKIESGVECRNDLKEITLMTTRYCIRKEIGECLKEGGKHKELYLEDDTNRFELLFDCKNCRMKIKKIWKQNL